LAFDHALKLQAAEARRRDDRVRRTLFGEIRDNMKLLYRPDPRQLGLLKSSAWDAARGLDWRTISCVFCVTRTSAPSCLTGW